MPSDHLVDAGYVDADVLITSQLKQQIRLVGPVRGDIHWQAREAKGYDLSCFTIDWEQRTVTCPQGYHSSKWAYARDGSGRETVQVRFRHSDSTHCPSRSRYLGLAKTHPQHLFTAIAINLVRFDAWLNEVPHAKTPTSRFAALAVANVR